MVKNPDFSENKSTIPDIDPSQNRSNEQLAEFYKNLQIKLDEYRKRINVYDQRLATMPEDGANMTTLFNRLDAVYKLAIGNYLFEYGSLNYEQTKQKMTDNGTLLLGTEDAFDNAWGVINRYTENEADKVIGGTGFPKSK
ncbi:MAG: hypothetical protein WCL13_04010 [bacterium]